MYPVASSRKNEEKGSLHPLPRFQCFQKIQSWTEPEQINNLSAIDDRTFLLFDSAHFLASWLLAIKPPFGFSGIETAQALLTVNELAKAAAQFFHGVLLLLGTTLFNVAVEDAIRNSHQHCCYQWRRGRTVRGWTWWNGSHSLLFIDERSVVICSTIILIAKCFVNELTNIRREHWREWCHSFPFLFVCPLSAFQTISVVGWLCGSDKCCCCCCCCCCFDNERTF